MQNKRGERCRRYFFLTKLWTPGGEKPAMGWPTWKPSASRLECPSPRRNRTPLAPTTGTMAYPISRGVFEKWRRNNYPVYLVVVIVPEDCEDWADFDVDDQTLARSAAYWAEVDRTKTDGPWTVGLHRENRLTPDTLRQWHAQAFGGGFGGRV